MAIRTVQLILTAALLLVSSWAWADVDHSRISVDKLPSDVASTWFEAVYDVVKAEETTPPLAARIYAITAVTLYESIIAGTKENRSLVGQLNDLNSVPKPKKNHTYYWPTVANAGLAKIIRDLYPAISQASRKAINSLEQSFASQQQVAVPKSVYERSVTHGQAVASSILDWATTDDSAIYTDCPYNPMQGGWEPTPPLFNPYPLQPCWGIIRPLVLTSGQECAPLGPPPFSTDPASEFYAAALEVYRLGLRLTPEQKMIADYWGDAPGVTGTPPGHWIAIVSQIARNDDLSLADAAEAYARVGIAVHDAFIQSWNTKYVYNLQRPVTYINDHIDPGWHPYLVTPGFPSYTSGHATQSAAAARVLTDMFGIKSFKDTTHTDHVLVPPQQPRTFDSFEEAAAEAAVSRLFGGVHFAFDNEDGLASGHCVGQAISDRVSFKDDEKR